MCAMKTNSIIVKVLGLQDYLTCWQAMQTFTNERQADTTDEIWILEHKPVFTQGQNGKAEHILNAGDIPIIAADRGGQVTYHGPGQVVVYTLIDVKRKKWNVRQLVTCLEQSVIQFLAGYQIEAQARCDAPGVYINSDKICSIGLRIRRGCSFHGLALNVTTDLEPFSRINPCGYSNLKMTKLSEHTDITLNTMEIGRKLAECLIINIGYTSVSITSRA